LATIAALLGSLVTAAPVHPAPSPFSGPASVDAARPDRCARILNARARGADAVGRAGSRLVEIAARHGLPAAALRDRLLSDDSLWLDECGAPFYVEPATSRAAAVAAGAAADAEPPTGGAGGLAALGPGDAFRLHSRPGANRVIFLDFDGAELAGTGWNDGFNGGAPFTAAPYDSDGAPGTFSSTEEAFIAEAWARVAEDFASFEVDVTTEDPGDAAIERSSASDTAFGTTALITRGGPVAAQCYCGGIAYVGVFDYTPGHAYYQPALAFVEDWYSAKDAAEIVSHEVGHNLGLSHDGNASTQYYDGQGAWAPLMGIGYYRPLTQWSRGDYLGASNTEDDFAVMVAHGAPVRGDDHGNAASTATALGGGTALAATGLIGSRTDIDWFTFTGSGPTTITVTPADPGADLDLRVDLYTSAGALIASADPPSAMVSAATVSGLDASISLTLPAAGLYQVRVDGTGFGDAGSGYSDYASVGQYRLEIATGDAPVLAQIGSFNPTAGVAGTEVTISGSGLAAATAVSIGGAAAAFTIVSDTSLRAVVPAAAVTGPIAVTTPAGSTTSPGAFTVRPSITALTPATGAVGTAVAIEGSGFTGATSVRFNGTSAGFSIASSTRINATVPSGATTGPVTVTTPAGIATGPSFGLAPTVSGFSPTAGALGIQVTISGANLGGTTGVRINGVSAAFTQVSTTQVRAVVPAGATTGQIAVTTGAGTATSAASFTVYQPPTIGSFSPASGAPNAIVTIDGTNFTGASAVRLNGTTMKYTVVSSTRLTATVPSSATTGPIAITTPGGTATSGGSFLVAPRISSFSPTSGTIGTNVTVTGANFTGASAVTLGGAAAAFTVTAATKITLTVPAGAVTGRIVVTTPVGSATSSGNYTVRPAISAFSPASGGTGTSVTIDGTGFTSVTGVRFGGVTATFATLSSTRVRATVPATALSGPISVITAGGIATSAASFTAAPRITGFSPTSASRGSSVTINGANFTGASAVRFNGAPASFVVNSASKITATVPTSTTTGRITVTTAVGTATSTATFTVR
jgi:hypothetical protein